MFSKLTGKVDLIFADPPFNCGEPYGDWDDNLPYRDYLMFSNEWVRGAVASLRVGGTIWINCPDEWVRYMGHLLDRYKCKIRRWCIWHYRFGQNIESNFISSHTHLLYAVKTESYATEPSDFTFNAKDVLVTSDRVAYGDKRTANKKSGTAGKRVPLDVWTDIPRVVGNSKERIPNRPNQMPERLLARIIKATSNKSDLVLDPFGGTGTTFLVARHLKRKAVTVEYDRNAAQGIAARVRKGVTQKI